MTHEEPAQSFDAAPEPTGWRPIETAPRDVPVLLIGEGREDLPVVAIWDDGDRSRDMLAPGPGWFVCSQYGGLHFTENDGHEVVILPTAWMPPPALPKGE